MIGRRFTLIDVAPRELANFIGSCRAIATAGSQAVLWHEEGFPRRLVVAGEEVQPDGVGIKDARETARALYEKYSDRVNRAVVTDFEGYQRLLAAVNIVPREGEPKFTHLERMFRALNGQFDNRAAIYPGPTLDRGPVLFQQEAAFLSEKIAETSCLLLAVFEGERIFFSWVAKVAGGETELATTFDRWPDKAGVDGFSGESLDRAAERVEAEIGPLACGLFLSREDFEQLFDGRRHDSLPGTLIQGGLAFGISNLPGVAEEAFLHTAGFFAYVPVFLP
ncbi:MAG: hypothetical protein V1794_12390 [Candidatus Glassbacteria bacterium]